MSHGMETVVRYISRALGSTTAHRHSSSHLQMVGTCSTKRLVQQHLASMYHCPAIEVQVENVIPASKILSISEIKLDTRAIYARQSSCIGDHSAGMLHGCLVNHLRKRGITEMSQWLDGVKIACFDLWRASSHHCDFKGIHGICHIVHYLSYNDSSFNSVAKARFL